MAISRDNRVALVDIHGFTGVALGLVLYVVVITGAVAVYAHEIGRWSTSSVNDATPFSFSQDQGVSLQQLIDDLARDVPERYHEEVSLRATLRGNLGVFFHTHDTAPSGNIDDIGVFQEIDLVTGAILERHEGWGRDLSGANQHDALERFLVEVHTALHIPEPWGLLLTGILGLAMLLAAVSGIFMHRHLFRDMFRLRTDRSRLLAARDNHTVAAAWLLPYAIVLAFTGSFFSLAGSIGIPVMAAVSFGGDQKLMIETILGVEPAADLTPAPGGALDTVINDAIARGKTEPGFVLVEHYGTQGAVVHVNMPPSDGKLAGAEWIYDGVSGEFVRAKPTIGRVPSAGSVLIDLMGPLHFGNFLAAYSKAIWFVLGLVMAYVIHSGLNLWITRRQTSRDLKPFRRLIAVMVWGTPFCIALSAWGFLAAYNSGDTTVWVPAAFLLGVAVVFLLGFRIERPRQIARVLNGLNGLVCMSAPALRWVSSDIGWGAAYAGGDMTLVSMDVFLIVAGLLFVRLAVREDEPNPALGAGTATPTGGQEAART